MDFITMDYEIQGMSILQNGLMGSAKVRLMKITIEVF